jgi:hypothetical protein
MLRKSWPILFSAVIGLGIGLGLNRVSPGGPAFAQDTSSAAQSNRTSVQPFQAIALDLLVQGYGRAVSALPPPGEPFSLFPSNAPQTSFTVVPAGKKFVLTDVMYEAQVSVRQTLIVNIASANLAGKTHDILFQVSLGPLKSDQVHLCSGYVIPAGHSLVAYTNYGMAPEQYVSISVSGFLTNQ